MTQPLTTEQLDAIRERLRAAERVSPGPWTMALPGDCLENATFIMNAKGDIDALLAEVERLRAENEHLRSVSWQNTVNRGGKR